MPLPRSFFEQKTLKVAKNLLGCFLIRPVGKKKIIARIIETEAYCGPNDLANHASKGKTKRTETMFGQAGHAYIYLIYGMYYCLNVVTENVGYPAAVLIRGIEVLKKFKTKNLKFKNENQKPSARRPQAEGSKLLTQKLKIIGPGKVCRELKIDKSFQGADLIKDNRLYFMRVGDDSRLHPSQARGFGGQVNRRYPFIRKIKSLPRVGVDYAKEYKDKKWRFVLVKD